MKKRTLKSVIMVRRQVTIVLIMGMINDHAVGFVEILLRNIHSTVEYVFFKAQN